MYNITVLECHKVYEIVISAHYLTQLLTDREAAWPSGQRVGLAIRRSRVRVPLCELGFLILLCCI